MDINHRLVTLRSFRDSIASYTEPVAVIRREGTTLRVIGVWTPAAMSLEVERIQPAVTEAARRLSHPFTPVPKPQR